MSDFNSIMIKKISHANEKNVRTAYHYTSPEAFLSIIKDGFIRFSDIDFMNDKSETVYAVKTLLDFLDENPGKYLFTRNVLSMLIGNNSYSDIQELKSTSVLFNDVPLFSHMKNRSFLFCLSTKKDSLNMWNYYVNNRHYEGFAIGFDLKALLKTFDTPTSKEFDSFVVYHGKVLYQKELQLEAAKRIADDIESMKTIAMSPIEPFAAIKLRNILESEGLFIKHPDFSSEQEYRIVISIDDNKIPHSQHEAEKYFGNNNKQISEDFCVKNGLIVPFLKVKVPAEAITKIVVSPITEFALAEKGINEILKVKEIKKATVEQSKIPIRF